MQKSEADDLFGVRMRISEELSRSLSFCLARQFLDPPYDLGRRAKLLPPVEGEPEPNQPSFLRMEQLGMVDRDGSPDPLAALRTTLTGCHVPAQDSRLIFVLRRLRGRVGMYFGTGFGPLGSRALSDTLRDGLIGNWPGTWLSHCRYDDAEFQRDVSSALEESAFPLALTGVPSLESADPTGSLQTLDRLLRSTVGAPFTYLVLARPMALEEVDRILLRCRELMGQVRALGKLALNRTDLRSLARTAVGEHSHSQQETSSTGRGSSWRLGAPLFGVLAGAARIALPQANLLSPFLLGADRALETMGWHETETVTQTEGDTVRQSSSLGVTDSITETVGTEYVSEHGRAAENLLGRYHERFEQARASGCWEVGVYVMSPQEATGRRVAAQLRALVSGEKSFFDPLRVHDLKDVWPRGLKGALQRFQLPDLRLADGDTKLEHLLGPAFSGLTTPLNTEELALWLNLPRREVPGLKLLPTADFSLNPAHLESRDDKMLSLGTIMENGRVAAGPVEYAIDVATLAKHTLVAGLSGSGKSTTSRHVLEKLLTFGYPFLVIEPTKDEYLTWARELNRHSSSKDAISIYCPGASRGRGTEEIPGLRLSPFDFVHLPGTAPRVLAHVDQLKAIMNAFFPMQEVLPLLLEELVFLVYSQGFKDQYGCDSEGWIEWSGDAERKPTTKPRLRDLAPEIVARVVAEKGYDKDVTANLTAALNTRLASLQRGWKREVFGGPVSTPWRDLFDTPVVINLQHVSDSGDRALIMSLLLLFLYEYRQAQSESELKRPNELRHLTLIEEAHRVLRRVPPERMDLASPQAKLSEMFADILAEIRAYGEGVLIVDQSPGRLIPDVIKNTNLKIVHRLVAQDDRELLAAAMGLTAEQAGVLNRLRPGQAIAFGDYDDKATWIEVPPPMKGWNVRARTAVGVEER